MAEWNGQMADGDYSIQFSTKDKEEYKFIEKACQSVMNNSYKDFVPVVHGKWTKDYDEYCYHWICSVCKGDIPRNKYQGEMFSDYCPNCGAKIDGGIENAS